MSVIFKDYIMGNITFMYEVSPMGCPDFPREDIYLYEYVGIYIL